MFGIKEQKTSPLHVIGTSKNFQFLGRPFLALLVRWAKRPEHRVRGSDWLSA